MQFLPLSANTLFHHKRPQNPKMEDENATKKEDKMRAKMQAVEDSVARSSSDAHLVNTFSDLDLFWEKPS